MVTKIIVIAALVVTVVGAGAGLWIVSSRENATESGREFFSAPRDYDTTGGQEMRPRWGDQERAEDGAAAR
jgi:Ti type entry exclusion protein TrbK